MTQTVLDSLPWWQITLIAACFVWSGFVRSGLGFGGAALALPIFLMFENDPLTFLPVLGFQLLFFSLLTVVTRLGNIDWSFLIKILGVMAVPFALGMIGLLNFPGELLSSIVYLVTLFYGVGYVLNRALSSNSKLADFLFISFGGYVSGVSLMGAPLIVAAGSRYIAKEKMRDTFFVLWIVMVILKLSTFVATNVNLQWRLTLLSFPLVALGHYLGLKVHRRIVSGDKSLFERYIGIGLVLISILGLARLLKVWIDS